MQAATAAFELPLTAVPIVASSVDQLLGSGAAVADGTASACAAALTELAASFLVNF